MIGGGRTLVLGAALLAAFACMDLWAQVPRAVQPGLIERQFEKPPEPKARPPGEIGIPEPGQKPPPDAHEIRFVLTKLILEGVTVYPLDGFRAVYESLLGKEVTLADVYRIADALTARYRNDGYVLSQVIVPAQSIEQGVVRLRAVEGYIAAVRIETEDVAQRARISAYTDKIRAVRPLTAAVLERYLLLLSDLPGLVARAVLTASQTESGASDLVVQVSQRRYEGGLGADNRGSRALGPYRASGDLELNSLLGGGARTGVRLVTSGNGELTYLLLAHDQFIGSEGGKLAIAVSGVRSRPQEQAILPLNLETESDTGTLTYSYPLVRSREQNLYLRGVFSAHNGKTELFSVRDTEDRIRALRLGLTYDRGDALGGTNIVDIELSQGLRGLGASSNGDPFLSRPRGRIDFSKVALYAARLQTLPGHWSALVAVNAQHAFTDLLAPELFSYGGEQFGRGYDPSELTGDHGAALKLELRYSGPLPGESSLNYTAYGFFDIGQVRQRTSGGFDTSQSAASTGLGVRLAAGRHLSAVAELAKPLTRIVAQEGDRKMRTYLGVAARF